MNLIITFFILFVIYKIYMKSTQKEREEMYKYSQENSTSTRNKKPIRVYSKGYVIHDVGNLYYKPDFGYSSIGGLSIDDEKSFRMAVYDHKKKKDIGYIKDSRLFKTLKEFPEHLCYINTPEECKYSCKCHYCYNDLEPEYFVSLKTYVRLTNEESHKIQEYSDKKINKTKRKLNSYLRGVGLFDESK